MSTDRSPRLKDSQRNTPVWEQIRKESGGEGPEFRRALADRPNTTHEFIGDDLSDEDLDDYWAYYCKGDRTPTYISGWLKDKPHQVHYRLINRLTRVEEELKQTRLRLAEVEGLKSLDESVVKT